MQQWTGDPIDVHDPRFWEPLYRLTEWAQAHRNATTLGDLLTLQDDLGELPEDVASAWAEVAATPIAAPMLQREGSRTDTRMQGATRAIRALLASLTERNRHIFLARALQMPDGTPEPPRQRNRAPRARPTLGALGQRYGITRERIRQIQQKTETETRRTLDAEPSVQWLLTGLRAALGVAFPLAALGEVPEMAALFTQSGQETSEESEAVWRTAFWLAGFSFAKDGWAVRHDTTPDLLRAGLQALAQLEGMLAYDDARAELAAAGVVPRAAAALLREELPGLRLFDDTFLPWGSSLTDKAETLLRWRHQPATDSDLFDLIGEEHSARGFRQRLNDDPRFVKTGKSTFGLRAWGMEEYDGISEAIAERIARAGGKVRLAKIAAELPGQFGVTEHSVRAHASAPRFVVADGWVRLRTDEPIRVAAGDPSAIPGVEQRTDGQLRFSIEVTSDTLRGAGRMMPGTVANALEVGPGQERTFVSAAGLTVRIGWPVTSPSGPNLGSVKALAEAAGVAQGDVLTLDFDPAQGHVTASRIPRQQLR